MRAVSFTLAPIAFAPIALALIVFAGCRAPRPPHERPIVEAPAPPDDVAAQLVGRAPAGDGRALLVLRLTRTEGSTRPLTRLALRVSYRGDGGTPLGPERDVDLVGLASDFVRGVWPSADVPVLLEDIPAAARSMRLALAPSGVAVTGDRRGRSGPREPRPTGG